MPVETIELVVHPLFRYIAEYRMRESKDAVFRYNNAEREVVKNRLANFGRLIKKVAADDKSVLCIVPAGKYDIKTKAFEDYKRLEKYARKMLGERCIILESAMGFTKSYWRSKLVKAMLSRAAKQLSGVKFSKEIHINATGEYAEECVKNALQRLKLIIRRRKIRVSVSLRKDIFTRVEDNMMREAEKGWLTAFRRWRHKIYGKRTVTMVRPK